MRQPPRIALIDYGMGNLKSVGKALEKVGAAVHCIADPRQIKTLDALVLPGVGAFSSAVYNLKKRRLFDPIKEWIVEAKPFLGICLGYQLLFEESEEAMNKGNSNGNSKIKGLCVFGGKVKRFPDDKDLKIPHIGWNQVKQCAAQNKTLQKNSSSLFSTIPDNSYFYFVHSYFPVLREVKLVASTTCYGTEFASSICKKNLFACQFHPEKSGKTGLRLLKNFVREVKNDYYSSG